MLPVLSRDHADSLSVCCADTSRIFYNRNAQTECVQQGSKVWRVASSLFNVISCCPTALVPNPGTTNYYGTFINGSLSRFDTLRQAQ